MRCHILVTAGRSVVAMQDLTPASQGCETYAAHSGEHDDLVLAVTFAVWFSSPRSKSGPPEFSGQRRETYEVNKSNR